MSESRHIPTRLTRPLLSAWREPGVLQLGFDEHPLVLSGVPQELERAVALLHQPHSPAELSAALPRIEPAWLDWLCEHLSTAGLLTHRPPAPRPVVRVLGSGRVAAALVTTLRRTGADAATTSGDEDPLQTADVVVVATEMAEPDRTVLNRLAREQAVHLVIRMEPARAVVGPLVTTWSDACVRCDDLSRSQLDRRWPVLLAQLCRTAVRPDPGLADWAAATAAGQIRCALAGRPVEVAGRTLEVGLADFRLRTRSWPVHPDCGFHSDGWATAGTLAG